MEYNIKILVDNNACDGLVSEHGLSLWLEIGSRKILFDTGQSDAVVRNAQSLGIDLSKTDSIVISHGHGDHTGGLLAVLHIAKKVKIFLHPSAVEPKYSRKASSVNSIGIPGISKQAIRSNHIIWTATPTYLFPGIAVTGQVPRRTDFEDTGGDFYRDEDCRNNDMTPDDQALFFESENGLVVVFGCAHSGVVNTLDYISKITGCSKMHTVIGGMHLINANQERITRTIEAFKKYDIQQIIPLHCTGREAMEQFKKAFGDKCLFSGAGEQINF